MTPKLVASLNRRCGDAVFRWLFAFYKSGVDDSNFNYVTHRVGGRDETNRRFTIFLSNAYAGSGEVKAALPITIATMIWAC